MDSNMMDPKKYRIWVLQELKKRQLSLESFAREIDLSESSFKGFIFGQINRGMIPRYIREPIERILGKYPILEQQGGFREGNQNGDSNRLSRGN